MDRRRPVAVGWIILRCGLHRTLAQATTSDFALLLIISEAAQPALTGDNYSLTNSLLVILTLLMERNGAVSIIPKENPRGAVTGREATRPVVG